MKQTVKLAIGILFLATAAYAATSFSPQESLKLGKDNLVLNGSATRFAGFAFITVPVYHAAFYLSHPSADSKAILSSEGPKVMKLEFVRSVSDEQIRDKWKDSFKTNCGNHCETLAPLFAEFLKSIPSIKEGETLTYEFQKDSLRVSHNSAPVASLQNSGELNTVLLASWLGDHPPSEEFKKGILGGTL